MIGVSGHAAPARKVYIDDNIDDNLIYGMLPAKACGSQIGPWCDEQQRPLCSCIARQRQKGALAPLSFSTPSLNQLVPAILESLPQEFTPS